MKAMTQNLEHVNRYYHTLCITAGRLAKHTNDKKLDEQNLFMGAASIIMHNGAMTFKGADGVNEIKTQMDAVVEQIEQVEKSQQENVLEETEITRIVPKTEVVEIEYEESHIEIRKETVTETMLVPEAVKVQVRERNERSPSKSITYDKMMIQYVEKNVSRDQFIPEIVKELKTRTENRIVGYEEEVVAQVDKVVGIKHLKGGYPLIKLLIGLGLTVQHYFCDDNLPDFSSSLSHGNLAAEQKLSKLKTKIEQLVDDPNGESELIQLLEKALVN